MVPPRRRLRGRSAAAARRAAAAERAAPGEPLGFADGKRGGSPGQVKMCLD